MEQEEEIRNLVTKTLQIAIRLEKELQRLPRGSLTSRNEQVPTVLKLLRYMKRALKLVKGLEANIHAEPHELLHHGSSHPSDQQLDVPIVAERPPTPAYCELQYYDSRPGDEPVLFSAASDAFLEGATISSGSYPNTGAVTTTVRRKAVCNKRTVLRVGNVELADTFIWRKYGEKKILGAKYKRSYFRCTHSGCPAKKQVQQVEEHVMLGAFDVTYINKHTCRSTSSSSLHNLSIDEGALLFHHHDFEYLHHDQPQITSIINTCTDLLIDSPQLNISEIDHCNSSAALHSNSPSYQQHIIASRQTPLQVCATGLSSHNTDHLDSDSNIAPFNLYSCCLPMINEGNSSSHVQINPFLSSRSNFDYDDCNVHHVNSIANSAINVKGFQAFEQLLHSSPSSSFDVASNEGYDIAHSFKDKH